MAFQQANHANQLLHLVVDMEEWMRTVESNASVADNFWGFQKMCGQLSTVQLLTKLSWGMEGKLLDLIAQFLTIGSAFQQKYSYACIWKMTK